MQHALSTSIDASNDSRATLKRFGYVVVRSADGKISTTDARHASHLDAGESVVAFDDLSDAERVDLREILFPAE